MTKRVNFLPSERIDVPDMTAGTTGVAVGTMQQILDDLVIAKFPRVASGFRVEIANQISSPGEVTVWNGLAVDRSGQIVENEDEENTQRSITLNADGTYYLEVEFTTTPSDQDARAFWDPTFDNGNDPSGDPRLPGREVFQTVATRLSPDWEIVNPVSTTGFAISTTPSSARIPVAVITVAAGVVTGATTFPARSCLAQVASIGATKLYVLDSRLMPDAFSATVDAEVIAVSANDRANGILTLSGPLASNHYPGERVVRTGGSLNQFLQNRAAAALPTSGTEDARPGLFQGSEDRGFALAQNPESASGRNDAQLQALKDQIDFLSAQLREIRFGGERGIDLGTLAPPTSFSSPRYYDRSGGLQGARYATVSIGDGTTCWGDFNVAQMGSMDAAMTAALAALPSAGGVIFVKGKSTPYDMTTGVAITSRTVTIIGERGRTSLRCTGAAAALQLQDCTLGLRDITIARQAASTAVAAITTTTGGSMTTFEAYNSSIEGISGLAYLKGIFENCTITEVAGGSSNGYGINARIVDCTFIKCNFVSGTNASGSRCVNVLGLGSKNISFYHCYFTVAGATQAAMLDLGATNDSGGCRVESCVFIGAATTTVQDAIVVGSSGTWRNLWIKGCRSSGLGAGGLINVTRGFNIDIEDCDVSVANANGYGMIFADTVERVSIKDCRFTQPAATNADTYGIITQGTCADFNIDRCTFVDLAFCIDVENMNGMRVRDCHAYTENSGLGRAFFWVVTSVSSLLIDGCEVQDFQDTTAGLIAGVRCTAISTHVEINNCVFRDLGAGAATNIYGVYIAETGITLGRNFSVTNCRFRNLNGTGTVAGVRCAVSSDAYQGLSVLNNQFFSIGTTAGSAAHAVIVNSVDVFMMQGNGINLIGNTGNTTAGYGLYIESVIADAQITGNVIANTAAYNLFFLFFGGGIVHAGAYASGVTIADNTITVTGNVAAGVALNFNNASSAISDITITGNTIAGDPDDGMVAGISIFMVDNTSLGQARIVISNNILRGFSLYGIHVNSTSGIGALCAGVHVSGNVMETQASAPVGIRLLSCIAATVTGNSILLAEGSATAKRALYIDSCEGVTITGNMMYAGGCSTDGFVLVYLCYYGSYVGNTILVALTNASFRGVTMNNTGVEVHVAGNAVRTSGTPAGASTNLVGSALAVCRENANANTSNAPSSLANTNMNWWQL